MIVINSLNDQFWDKLPILYAKRQVTGTLFMIYSFLDLLSLAKFVRKAKKKSMPTIWNIPNDLWEEFKLVLPPEKPARTVGRPAVQYRKVLNGILYVLRTGCPWKKVPKEFGSGSTCHARFQEWVSIGVFENVWKRLLEIYDELKSIGWDWQSMDSVPKAPLGGKRPSKPNG